MEEKEFNALVEKIEKSTGEKITAQLTEALKELNVEELKALLATEIVTADQLEGLAKSESIDEIKTILEEQGLELEAMKGAVETKGDPMKAAAKEIADNKDTLKQISARQSSKEVVIKALTLRSSVATNTIGLDLPGLGRIGRKARTFFEFLSKQVIPLPQDHAGIIRYRDWNEATTVAAAAAVAEGAAFPESTATFKGYTLPIEKIGDTLPVTEEFFEDEPTAAAELGLFLQSNVLDKVDADIILADGISPNVKSLDSEATAYTAPDLAIPDPNIFDLMVKVQEDIEANFGNKYMTDFFVMNIADYNALVLKKDANNNYIFDRELREMPWEILVDNNVVANTMYAGDSRYARLYEIPGVALSQGMVNAQFTEDELTIKARKRLAFLIRNIDKTGFRNVSSISAALTLLGAP